MAALSIHSRPHDSETEQVVYAALDEVGRGLPARGTDEARLAAAAAMAWETLEGRMPPRELARWAHSAIGHGGPAVLKRLVGMDDVYDTLPYVLESESDVDEQVLDAARQLIAATQVDQ